MDDKSGQIEKLLLHIKISYCRNDISSVKKIFELTKEFTWELIKYPIRQQF